MNNRTEGSRGATRFLFRTVLLVLVLLGAAACFVYWRAFVRLQPIEWKHQLHYPDGRQVILIEELLGPRGANTTELVKGKYRVRGKYDLSLGELPEVATKSPPGTVFWDHSELLFGFRDRKTMAFVGVASFRIPDKTERGGFEVQADLTNLRGDLKEARPEVLCVLVPLGEKGAIGKAVLE